MNLIHVVWLLAGSQAAGQVSAPAASAAVVQAAPSDGPLMSLPQGWYHVPLEVRDASRGAYLDEVSGAIVEYSVERHSRTADASVRDATAIRSSGAIGDVKYELVRLKDARAQETDRWRREIGPQFPTAGSLEGALVPPEHSTALLLTIALRDRWLNFQAWLCNEGEDARAVGLLLGQKALHISAWPSQDRKPTTRVSEALGLGTPLRSVLETWGAPTSIWRPRCDRVAVAYQAGMKGADTIVQLTFDGAGKLVDKAPVYRH